MLKDQDALVRLESDRYYILASSSYADDQTRVLNSGDTFGIFDRWGDTKQFGSGIQGIYHQDTRFVSDCEFRISGYRPLLLSSSIKNENEVFSIDLTNPRMQLDNGRFVEKGVIHIARNKFLQEGICYESIVLHNYDINAHSVDVSLFFKGDFRDIFEVRGMQREKRGNLLSPEKTTDGHLKLIYVGADHIRRTTWVRFDSPMLWTDGNNASHHVHLDSGEHLEIRYSLQFQIGENDWAPDNHLHAFEKIVTAREEGREKIADIYSSNEQFTKWLERSKFDMLSLLWHKEHAIYPYAGVPWYNTPFGRDGLITALETLWVAPEVARGVLLFLAATQATTEDPFRDAEPGKIMHETRSGEMAQMNEIPFRMYYGTVDATPLFVALAGHYYKRTADKQTIRRIWKNIERALDWIENYGDIDNDGFVEYKQKSSNGLENQGWKDSFDSVSHEDGTLASPSIALCEVQGYVYDAYIQASYLAKVMDDLDRAKYLRYKAKELKAQFNEAFWDKELQTLVLALDGNKNPCRIKTSNAGQCLFTGIVSKRYAPRLVKTLMQFDMFTGWGIRTLSSTAARYNPMSYHNGSVWPHDTALIAAGMTRYGFVNESIRLMQGLFDASLFFDLQRMPELFCGFPARSGEAPTSYPVACIPQAWSTASVWTLLQACLQISIDAPNKKVIFNQPRLPPFLKRLVIRSLKVADGSFDLELSQHEWDVGIHAISKPEEWQLVVYK